MQRLKLFVPPVPTELLIGELKNIVMAGIAANPNAELARDERSADLIILDFRHLENKLYEIKYPDKTIIVDYRDPAQYIFLEPSLLYFKRSIVTYQTQQIITLQRDYIPIAYCVRQEYLELARNAGQRDLDIAVLFDPEEDEDEPRNRFRTGVARYVKRNFSHRNIFVGTAGAVGETGRSFFQNNYEKILLRAKIIVTCNPDRWEGDSRLFEALASGAAVLSDQMQTPVLNPFVDGEHLCYFDRKNLPGLGSKLALLLHNENYRQQIASSGYEFVHKHHKPEDRIQQILDEFNSVVSGKA